jgi:chaperonin GroEL
MTPAKQIIYDKEARDALKRGVDALAKTVTVTLGPKGRNVAIDRTWAPPIVLHDGVSVAKEVWLKDPFENMGAQLVKQVSSQTNDRAGDGTTTATLLAQSLIGAGLALMDDGVNPMTLKKGMDRAKEDIVAKIKDLAKEISTNEEIEQVATISSADPAVGKIIATAMKKIGKDGILSVDDGSKHVIEVEYKDGMEFEKGFVSNAFVTDPQRMEAVVDRPYILVTDHEIISGGDLRWLKKWNEETNRVDLVIICGGIDGDALRTLTFNKLHGNLKCLAIVAPAFAARREQLLQDIAILTGGTYISKEIYKSLDEVSTDLLGQADGVVAGEHFTRIIGGHGSPDAIQKRIEQIREEVKRAEGKDFEQSKLKERLAKLSSGVAVIKVGAMTEVEMEEKKERVIDAVAATKSAVEEGVLPGGGVALLRIGKDLVKNLDSFSKKDASLGYKLVLDVLCKPATMLLQNAGYDDKEIEGILKKISDSDNKALGFNVESEEYEDFYNTGVLDPAKVTRLALENAVSVASMVLTTDSLVTEIPDPKLYNVNP